MHSKLIHQPSILSKQLTIRKFTSCYLLHNTYITFFFHVPCTSRLISCADHVIMVLHHAIPAEKHKEHLEKKKKEGI